MTNFFWKPHCDVSDYEIKENHVVFDGNFQVNKVTLRHRLYSGEWSPWLQREYVQRLDAAAAILYDPDEHKVVMIEQFRVGLIGQKSQQSPWMLEVVAGLLEDNERPEDTILREAIEEAGCEIRQLIKIGDFYNTPGGFSEKTSVFCGMVSVKGVGGVHGIADEVEDILVHILSPEAVFDAIDKGELVTSASTLIALQWLRMHLAKIDTTG